MSENRCKYAELRLLAALAFLTAAGAGQALAACGDYVMIGGEHSTAASGSLVERGMPSAPLTRCDGPNCQRQTPLPMGPGRDLPKLSSSDRACLLVTLRVRPTVSEWFGITNSPRPLEGCRPAIEHPPRASA